MAYQLRLQNLILDGKQSAEIKLAEGRLRGNLSDVRDLFNTEVLSDKASDRFLEQLRIRLISQSPGASDNNLHQQYYSDLRSLC